MSKTTGSALTRVNDNNGSSFLINKTNVKQKQRLSWRIIKALTKRMVIIFNSYIYIYILRDTFELGEISNNKVYGTIEKYNKISTRRIELNKRNCTHEIFQPAGLF